MYVCPRLLLQSPIRDADFAQALETAHAQLITQNPFVMKKLTLIFSAFLLLSGWHLAKAQPLNDQLPPLTVEIYQPSKTEGYYFCVPYSLVPPYEYVHALTILDRSGNVVYYKYFNNGGVTSTPVDFKIQPNGQMSFYSTENEKYYMMDSTFTIVDSLEAVNGSTADPHELQILENGNYLLLAYEIVTMDLSDYYYFGASHNLPGSSEADVIAAVIQEFDPQKNLIFEWKAAEHFDFDDVDESWLNSPNYVDWTHANALELDYDGNILMSCRHFNQIVKIDHNDGHLIWRFGGKDNEFTYDAPPEITFTGQHDIRRNGNGNLTLWNNGQFSEPQVGAALEFEMDEENKTVHIVWNYVYDNDLFSLAMGNHQQISSHKRLIDFGFTELDPPPMFTVVEEDYTPIMTVFAPQNYGSYRSYNYPELPWDLPRPGLTCKNIDGEYYLVADEGYSEYHWQNGLLAQSIPIDSPGAYQVFVPFGGGMLASEVFTVEDPDDPCGTTTATKEEELSEQADISVYPNPAHDLLRLKWESEEEAKAQIQIFDLTGRLVLKQELQSGENSMSLGHLPKGSYLIVVRDEEGRALYRKRIMLM